MINKDKIRMIVEKSDKFGPSFESCQRRYKNSIKIYGQFELILQAYELLLFKNDVKRLKRMSWDLLALLVKVDEDSQTIHKVKSFIMELYN